MDPIVAFTDGSALRNGAAGFAVVLRDYPEHNFAAALPRTTRRTSNRAEFSALVKTFEIADVIDPARARPLECFTDSMLLVNSVTRWMAGWKRNRWRKRDGSEVLNLDLLLAIDAWLALRPLRLHHVPAHGRGHTEQWKRDLNDVADRLARAAALRASADTPCAPAAAATRRARAPRS